MLRTAMSSLVTKNQKLSSTDISGQIDPRPRVLMENPNAFALLFQDKYKHDNKNPRARFNYYIGRKDDYHVRKRQFREKVEGEKRKLESDKKRRKIDDRDDFDDNDYPIYRDDEGNIIPTFKTKDDGTNNNLLDRALDLNNFWNSWGKETQPGQNLEAAPETTSESGASEPGEEVLDVDDEDRKEADVTLNRFFQNVEREANKIVRFNVDQDEYEDRIDDYHWARFAGGYKDNNYLRIINEIERRGLNTSENRDFIDYLSTDECERVMEGNDITIHVESGEYLVGELETGESLYDFLALQTDEDKKVIRKILRCSSSLKSFTEDYMQYALGTEEKWLLDSDLFVYSKYLVANHNSGYLVMRGQEPIYCRHSRATEDDVMLKSMNENNWHDFLYNAIEGALTNKHIVQNEFVDNIFENLNICFRDYKLMFKDVAVNYYQMLLTSSRDNVIRVLKFIDAPLRNIKDFVEVVGAQQLFHMCVQKSIQAGRTPLTNSPRTLPDIKPPEHLDSGVSLPNFSILYSKYRNSAARWMLSAFFLAQLFQEISEETLSSELLIVNMLEELLWNCSARELMSSPKDRNIQFHQVEHFANTFIDILREELSSNSQQLELEQSTYRQNLRKTFEKSIEETSSILDSARKSGRKTKSYFEGSDKSQTSRGLDEDIRSRFVTDNKSSVLIDRRIRIFAPNTTYTPSKSPISSRTRSKADARDIKSKGVYSYATFNNTDIKKEEEEGDE